MKKFTHLTRVSIMLAVFYGLDKGLGIFRQILIGRQFGLSADLDAFNVANNLPDMLFALISGGALAIAFIPVLSEVLTKDGRSAAWDLFSRIANLALVVTAGLSLVIALLAEPLVGWQIGIAPGFSLAQQHLVANLMRLNLIATLIFSISGLVMAGLQANQHFLLPALAPLFYNLGQIFGAMILSPEKGYSFGPITLPAFNLGIYGLVYGVIIGAVLHLAIQIPGLIRYQYHWIPRIGIKTPAVRQVLTLLGPRLLTMLFIQLGFVARDNLASRLGVGPVSALTYGWMVMQVPETLIGTAIGTAMLPTLAEQAARGDWKIFRQTIERAVRVLVAITLPVAMVLSIGIRPLLSLAFHFDAQGTEMLTWVTRVYLFGVVGHSLIEVGSRSFYAQQEAKTPLLISALTAVLYIGLAALLLGPMGAVGISLANTIAFTCEAILLLVLLARRLKTHLQFENTLWLAGAATLVAGACVYFLTQKMPLPELPLSVVAMAVGAVVTIPFIWKELRLLFHL